MTNKYTPVVGGPAKRKANNSTKPKIPTRTASEIRNVVKVEELFATEETFAQITDLASQGYSNRSIAYMMGVTAQVFNDFRAEYEEEVSDAITLGYVIDETEVMQAFRSAATDRRSGAFASLLLNYGKIKFGWAGGSGGESSDLPSSITFTKIEKQDVDE